jgi:hypothetical protein
MARDQISFVIKHFAPRHIRNDGVSIGPQANLFERTIVIQIVIANR